MISEKLVQAAKLEKSQLCMAASDSWGAKTLNINITGRCNEQCVYCPASQSGVHRSATDIDEDLFYRVTKEAFELGVTDVGLYTSGEPFLNPNIYKYIAWCKDVGFPYVYVSTNGILCNLENVKKAAEAGLDSLKFSIAGATRKTFSKHHGVDSYEVVKKNIIQAYQYREQHHPDLKLYLFAIITKYNLHEKEDIRKTFGKYVDELVFSDCIDGPVPLIGIKEYLSPGQELNPYNRKGKGTPCPQLFNKIVVDEDGWFCACCTGSGKKYGQVANLQEISLKDAVNSPIMVRLRQRHLNHDLNRLFCNICLTGHFDEENMHAFNEAFEEEAQKVRPLDIREDIKRRFE